MAVINEGSRSQVANLFELAGDLDEQVSYMMTKLEEIQDTLSQLTALRTAQTDRLTEIPAFPA